MSRLTRVASVVLAAVLGLTAAACSGPGGRTGSPTSAGGAGTIDVVATTTVLADLVRQVGGPDVSVASLVPKGGEVHTFDPKPGDIARVADADLLIANGLGLDDWLTRLAKDAGTNAQIVRLGDGVPSTDLIVEDGVPNPHLWLDPALAGQYAKGIAAALGGIDRAHANDFVARADAYAARMTALGGELRTQVQSLPAESRRVVADHDALSYFARALGFDVVGVVLSVPGQEPSAADLARVAQSIRSTGARVVISEVQFSPQLAKTLADETGARVVTEFYSDSVGDPPLDTLEAIIRWDTDRILEAVR